ncbi:hypothetical protein [Rhodococcus pyridinivorans]|uniref:hypothetical protein n=1 Tax=Rhodococcus pyridinivorans TaxID=103816 RepID=UPI003AAAC030
MPTEAVRVTITYLVDGEEYSTTTHERSLHRTLPGDASGGPVMLDVSHCTSTPPAAGGGLLRVAGTLATDAT